MNKLILSVTIFLSFFLGSAGYSQIGGMSSFEFLNLTSSPRIAAMGGDFLTIQDNDITIAPFNPSLINPGIDGHLGVNYVDFYSDINYGSAAYSKTFQKTGSFLGTVQYINYGSFDGTDESGQRTGEFNSSETAVGIGWGRQLDSLFSIGSNLKFIYSGLETYNAYGLAVDVAGSYTSADKSFVASIIAKNIGRQLKSYEGGNIQPLPFELQIGLSKKLKHLPFRYSVLFNHLEKWDLRYSDPATLNVDPISGETIDDSKLEKFADNLMRHIVIGGELLIGKNLSVRAGYNYKRRQELKIEEKTSTVGFSWGIGFRVSKFHFNYARSTWHLAGSPNYISVTTNLSEFFVNKN
ncbi:MAG: type IX secretion system protein PorQ [Bacteroidales bacterium]|nr:type IX secretion system protein PorQ [Bacteroidales bacterium]